MRFRAKRQTVFVCSAIINNKIVSEVINNDSSEKARGEFLAKNNVEVQEIHGPFYRKRMGVLDTQIGVKFAGKNKIGIYDDWNVRAMLLDSPPESAWILFESRIDGKTMVKPKSTIVRLSDIKFENDANLIKNSAIPSKISTNLTADINVDGNMPIIDSDK